MASIPFTLAALATSAVSGLQVSAASAHHSGGLGAFTSAHLMTGERDVLVRIPNTPHAEVMLSAEVLGLAALSDGARELLPVEVPETLGLTRAGDTRAVVTTFLPGNTVQAADIASDAILLESLSQTLASIHELPISLVQRNGLPVRSAADVREQTARIVDRAAATHLLPETVFRSWSDSLQADSLWDFAPCVVHGSLNAEQFRVSNDTVVGLLGWDALAVADPAADFTWLFDAGASTYESVLAHYSANRGVSGSQSLRERARLYHQLEVAKWLLHGVDTHDQSIIDDSVTMLDQLVDRIGYGASIDPVSAPLGAADVEVMLQDTPSDLRDPRSETAEYDSLDEDRVFDLDNDFSGTAPLTAEHVDEFFPESTDAILIPDSDHTAETEKPADAASSSTTGRSLPPE